MPPRKQAKLNSSRKQALYSAGSPEARFADAVRRSGLPSDSLSRFMQAGYIPQPRQMFFHAAARMCDLPGGPTDIGFGGARGPGKSHAAFAQLILDDCQRMPDLKCLFLRKVAKSAREAFGDLRREVLRYTPHEYKSQAGMLELPNGSRVILGHFRTEQDIDSYLGLQYDLIVIEEATQLTPQKKRDIKTCLRTSKRNWRPRTYQTTNPGGVDHQGFKSQFVVPWRDGQESRTRFVPATVYDNRFVNVEYRQNLEDLTGWQRRAWLEGDWDIAAGQYFTNWRDDACTVPWFPIPKHWPMWASLDYGFTHPTAVYFFTEADGQIYVVDEHVENHQLPDYHAKVITERLLANHGRTMDDLDIFVAGLDCFQQRGNPGGLTIADQYAHYGIVLSEASVDRQSGWSEILRRFGEPTKDRAPTIKIFRDRCPQLITCIPTLEHNPKNPEDVLKRNYDPDSGQQGDDEADAFRYGVMVRSAAHRADSADSALAHALS